MHAAPSLGDEFPDFTAQTHKGEIKWHDFIADSWALLFAHPEDFLPVSTTELGSVQSLQKAFEQRGVKCCALSCGSVESHRAWATDIMAVNMLPGTELF